MEPNPANYGKMRQRRLVQGNGEGKRGGIPSDVDEEASSLATTPTMTYSIVSNNEQQMQLSSSSHGALARRNLWDKFKDDDFVDLENDNEEKQINCGCHTSANVCLKSAQTEIRRYISTIGRHPRIILYMVVIVAFMCTFGFLALHAFAHGRRVDMIHRARFQAIDNGEWFSERFSSVLSSLYSLQLAVMQSPYFKHLSDAIGERGAPGSAPAYMKGTKYYRDITGICDDEELNRRFQEIVDVIRQSSGMGSEDEGIIVNYRLAPHGVFCLIDPVKNYRDFVSQGKGLFFDSQEAVGWDVLYENSERWYQTVRETIGVDNNPVSIYGPHDSVQNGIEMIPLLYCGHLSVNMPGYEMKLDGETYNSWGFVMVFMHFQRLIERSKIHERFAREGMEFQMIRKDRLRNMTTGAWFEKVNIIAESKGSHILNDDNSIEIPFDTPNGVWINKVGFACGFGLLWMPWAQLSVIIFSLAFSMTIAVTMVERQLHQELLYRMLPSSAVRKVKLGRAVVEKYSVVTTCVLDIVEYNTLSGEMRPIQVMKMLNEFNVQVDKVADKHKVYKIETNGDTYTVIGGAPDRCAGQAGAEKVALFALDVLELAHTFRTSEGTRLFIQAGINSGPVVAGVVGTKQPQYAIFGESVHAALLLELTSLKERIQCSDFTYRLLHDAPNYQFDFDERGMIDVDDKGLMHTWWILGATKRGSDEEVHESFTSEEIIQRLTMLDPIKEEITRKRTASKVLMEKEDNEEGVTSSQVTKSMEEDIFATPLTSLVEGESDGETLSQGRSSCSLSSAVSFKDYLDISVHRSAMRRHYYENWVHSEDEMNQDMSTHQQQWFLRRKLSFAADSINYDEGSLMARRNSVDSVISMEIEVGENA